MLDVKIETVEGKTVVVSDDFTKRRLLACLSASPLSESLQKANPAGVLKMFEGKDPQNVITAVNDTDEETAEYHLSVGDLVKKLTYHITLYNSLQQPTQRGDESNRDYAVRLAAWKDAIIAIACVGFSIVSDLVQVSKVSKLEKTVSAGGRGRKSQALRLPDDF